MVEDDGFLAIVGYPENLFDSVGFFVLGDLGSRLQGSVD